MTTKQSGPLGALRLSRVARRALVGCAVLAAVSAVALVVQAWAVASVLADVVRGAGAPIGERLGVLAGAVLARAILGWATQVVAARAAAGAKAELRAVLLDRALGAGPEWIVEAGPAELTALATRGLDALDGYFTSYLPALVNAAVLPVGIGGVVLLADWPSAVVIAVTLPLVPVFAILIGLRTRDRVTQAADATGRLSAHLLELARALPILTAFRRAAGQAEAVRRASDAHRAATMGTLRIAFASALALELIATLSVALVAVTIGLRLVSGDLGLAVGLFVLILAPECYLPLRAAGAAHHASEDGLEAARRVADLPTTPATTGVPPPPGDLVVTDLTVRRRNENAPDGLSLTARPGEITRLDSPSGTGKSTLFAVLLGFTRPTGGRVQVGGADLADLDPEAWRHHLAWVPQTPTFTGATVAEEIGSADRDIAAKVAVEHLLDRPVTELSTGERQRVAVARALRRLRDGAMFLLLDEPTAHLDPATAGLVMTAVEEAAGNGAAVILASHRATPSTQDIPAAEAPASRPAATAARARARVATLLDRRLLAGAALGACALLAGVALTVTSAWLIAKAAQQPPILTLSVAVVGVRAFGLGRAVLRYLERLVTHDAAFRAAGGHRVALWRGLARNGPAHTADFPALVHDIDTVRDLTPRVLTPPLVAALVCVAAVLVQLVILPAAAFTLVIAVAAAGLGAPAVALALDRRAGSRLATGRRRIATRTLTLLDAAAELIAFGAHHRHRAAIAATDAELTRSAKREAFGAGAATLISTLGTGAAAVAGTALAATAVAGGTLDPLLAPVCALLPLALAEVLALVPPAAQHHRALRAALARTRPEEPVTRSHEYADHIELLGVDARWPGAAGPALTDVTLDVRPGTHVAVVGPSGAGKSTLLALLLGFLDADRGTAKIPRDVAWCPQEPLLAGTTVRENLRLADPDATDAQLADALRLAGIGHWAHRLDTRRAATASGGEAQRLALARALLAAPHADLVLLDEPTAHLDIPTARRVLEMISALPTTVIHVTHREEETAYADLIVEVSHGRVNSVRTAHSHGPQGSPDFDATGGDRQFSAAASGGRTALA
ncbi:MAG: thiol reductant ABC exporter subunit CydD [Actinophytocola sp.]|uniref:thiol reductant ABC exporter subunit CydD n=1 Tax=Actinophytocola sp. TaxID=1872138 RepID=UPI001322C1BD|nr:thiol reductant ABC exporter subunit CydD [Actinophytocola sp.]MPZ80742.1 thiol reductant ABC exporter subunit CydD [Actinophytocola sp.]